MVQPGIFCRKNRIGRSLHLLHQSQRGRMLWVKYSRLESSVDFSESTWWVWNWIEITTLCSLKMDIAIWGRAWESVFLNNPYSVFFFPLRFSNPSALPHIHVICNVAWQLLLRRCNVYVPTLDLGWSLDLLWPIECSRSNTGPVLSLSLKWLCLFSLVLLLACSQVSRACPVCCIIRNPWPLSPQHPNDSQSAIRHLRPCKSEWELNADTRWAWPRWANLNWLADTQSAHRLDGNNRWSF